jgi:ketosteroid isomerase-like protein
MPLAADTASDIRSALDYYAEVWNDDDVAAIEGYYHPDFVLVTANGVIDRAQQLDGIRALLGEGGDRGRMEYSQVTVEELGEKHALAYGRVSLEFKDSSTLERWFTTVYVKTPFGWKALLTRN